MLSVAPFEPNSADTFNPSAIEQELLESINRMRLAPQDELDVLFTSLDPLTARDPSSNAAIQYYNDPTTAEILSEWSTLTEASPLAWNFNLFDAAVGHTLAMISEDVQSHQLPGEASLGSRVSAAGYSGYAYVGENIFAYADSAFHAHSAFAIDWGVPSRGHRTTMMNDAYTEVGISVIQETDQATAVGPLVVTQDFGSRFAESDPYLLGVAYEDANGNSRYDAGEGLDGVTIEITADGQRYSATTMSAGGYQTQVEAGTYTIRAFGGSLASPMNFGDIVVGGDNIKVDFLGTRESNEPPVVDLNGSGLSGIDYAAILQVGSGPATIGSDSLTVDDANDSYLNSATVIITNRADAELELLDADTFGTGITATFDSDTGTLTLTGQDLAANYQQVLRSVTYNNLAETPTLADRLLHVTVSDSMTTSETAVSTLTLVSAAIDDTWLEAETTLLTGSMQAGNDILASGGQYLWTPSGTSGSASFTFDVGATGTYTLWGRTIAPNSTDDSFFVQVDDGPTALWDMTISPDWVWDRVSHRGDGDMTYDLTAGTHSITVFTREDGAKLDQLLLTNNADITPKKTGPSTTLWMESEVGTFTGAMTTGEDADASTSQYAWTPSGTTGSVSYTLNVEADDDYLLWGRVFAPTGTDDSFFVQIDDGPITIWDTTVASGWTWDRVNARGEGDLVYSLTTGEHTLTLFTREDGAKLDKLLLTNNATFVPNGHGSSNLDLHWMDAQTGTLDAPMVVGVDPEASGEQYVWTPSGATGSVSFTVTLDQAGDYALWGRVLAPTKYDDSFFVQVDGGPTALWDTTIASEWTWDQVSNRGEGDLVYSLSAGQHTITLFTREDGAKLDKLLLVNHENYTPLGQGPSEQTSLFIQAESGSLTSPMTTGTDADAGGGEFLWTPAGSSGAAQFTFSVDTTGDYAVMGRVLAANGRDDSFFVQVDDGITALWDTTVSSSWVWDRVSDRATGDMSYFLTAGMHTITVLTREDGAKLDQLMLTPITQLSPAALDVEEHWFETENGTLQAPMTVGFDESASGGQYAWTSSGTTGSLSFDFTVDAAGQFALWGRLSAPDVNHDSFFVQIDGGPEVLWDTAISDDWVWDRVADRSLGDMLFNLDIGEHTLTILTREAGVQIDKLLLTSDAERSAIDFALSEDDWLV